MVGDQSSLTIEAHGDWLGARYEAEPDITLQEFWATLDERGVPVGYGGLWRFFLREAAEQTVGALYQAVEEGS